MSWRLRSDKLMSTSYCSCTSRLPYKDPASQLIMRTIANAHSQSFPGRHNSPPHRPCRPPRARAPRQLSRLRPPHELGPRRPPHCSPIRLRLLNCKRPLIRCFLRISILSRQFAFMVQRFTNGRKELPAHILWIRRLGDSRGRHQKCAERGEWLWNPCVGHWSFWSGGYR